MAPGRGCRQGRQRGLVILVTLLCGLTLPVVFTLAAGAADPALRIAVDGDRISLEAEDAPLAEVLQELGQEGGFEVELRGNIDARVTESIVDLPVSQAIGQLLVSGRYSFFLQFAPRGRAGQVRALAKLTVISPDDGAVGSAGPAVPFGVEEEELLPVDENEAEAVGTKEAVEALEEMLREEEDPETRQAIIEALEELAKGGSGI